MSEDEDGKRVVCSFRCSPELADRIDRYLERLRAENPGGNWTRSSAILNLTIKQLDEEGVE